MFLDFRHNILNSAVGTVKSLAFQLGKVNTEQNEGHTQHN